MRGTANPLVTGPFSVTIPDTVGFVEIPNKALSDASLVTIPAAAGYQALSWTFNYTGALQTFVVPKGRKRMWIECYGAQGQSGIGIGGRGGYVKTKITVTHDETLNLYVGGSGLSGGWNGGNGSSRGGGASDVRQGGTALANRVAVAGGGGGGTEDNGSGHRDGGAGGGLTGGGGDTTFAVTPATGGTQSAGGIGIHYDGSLGNGGNCNPGYGYNGGGGGGGYYGGGGGTGDTETNSNLGSGAGGSGYSAGTDTIMFNGVQTGDGMIVLTDV